MADQQDGVRDSSCRKPSSQSVASRSRWLVGSSSSSRSGSSEQHGGERHAHAPAAGEIAAGPGLGLGVEAEAGQDGGGARRGAMGLDIDQPGMDLGDPVRVAGRLGLGQQARALDIGGEHGLQQALGSVRGFLGQHAEALARGHGDLAAVGLERARDELQQGRFAGAVAPDQPGMVAVGQSEADPVQQDAPGDAIGEVGDLQHGGRLLACRGRARHRAIGHSRRGRTSEVAGRPRGVYEGAILQRAGACRLWPSNGRYRSSSRTRPGAT